MSDKPHSCYLVAIKGKQKGTSWPLHTGQSYKCGRDRKADIILESDMPDSLSYKHALVTVDDKGDASIESFSASGTLVNGHKIESGANHRTKLGNGAVIAFAYDCELKLCATDAVIQGRRVKLLAGALVLVICIVGSVVWADLTTEQEVSLTDRHMVKLYDGIERKIAVWIKDGEVTPSFLDLFSEARSTSNRAVSMRNWRRIGCWLLTQPPRSLEVRSRSGNRDWTDVTLKQIVDITGNSPQALDLSDHQAASCLIYLARKKGEFKE